MAKHDPDLSRLFHALADPTRRSILTRLAAEPTRATAKDGRTRTCALVPDALAPAQTWMDEQRAIWDSRLDRLEAFVATMMKEGKEG